MQTKNIIIVEYKLERKINLCKNIFQFRGIKPATIAQMEANKKLRG